MRPFLEPTISEDQVTDETKPCPKGCDAMYAKVLWGSYVPVARVSCLSCGWDGPKANTEDEAIAAWNARTPDPLDFEHLRQWGFAPGSYHCFCSECGEQHTADKRAWRCLSCAEKRADRTPDPDALVGAAWEAAAQAIERLEPDNGEPVTDFDRGYWQAQNEDAALTRSMTPIYARDAFDRGIAEAKAEGRREILNVVCDGNRPLPTDRDQLGRLVRDTWVRWAKEQPNPKPSWLLSYDELTEPDQEVDRRIGEDLARWTLVFEAARLAAIEEPDDVG